MKLGKLLTWFKCQPNPKNIRVPFEFAYMYFTFQSKTEQDQVQREYASQKWNALCLKQTYNPNRSSTLFDAIQKLECYIDEQPKRAYAVVLVSSFNMDGTYLVETVATCNATLCFTKVASSVRLCYETHLNPFRSPILKALDVGVAMVTLEGVVKQHWNYVQESGITAVTILHMPLRNNQLKLRYAEDDRDLCDNIAPFNKSDFDEAVRVVDGVVLKSLTLNVNGDVAKLLAYDTPSTRLIAYRQGKLHVGTGPLSAMHVWICAVVVHANAPQLRNGFVADFVMNCAVPLPDLKALWQTAYTAKAMRVLGAILLHPHSNVLEYSVDEVRTFIDSTVLAKIPITRSLLHRILVRYGEALGKTADLKSIKGLLTCYRAMQNGKKVRVPGKVMDELNRVMVNYMYEWLTNN